jgi:hypothetical protein
VAVGKPLHLIITDMRKDIGNVTKVMAKNGYMAVGENKLQ